MSNTIAGSTITVEIAQGANPDATPAGYSWTDISTYVRADGVKITRGRSDYNTHASPMTASFTVNNTDGRFTPNYRPGAYWPYARKSLPVRIKMDGTVRFVGYVDELPLSWPDASATLSWVPLVASGRWRRIAHNPLASGGALYRSLVSDTKANNGAQYWPLTDGADTGVSYSVGPTVYALTPSGTVTWQDVDGLAGFDSKMVSISGVTSELSGTFSPTIDASSIEVWATSPAGAPVGDYWQIDLSISGHPEFDLIQLRGYATIAGSPKLSIRFALAGADVWVPTATAATAGWNQVVMAERNTIIGLVNEYQWAVNDALIDYTSFGTTAPMASSIHIYGGNLGVAGAYTADLATGIGQLVLGGYGARTAVNASHWDAAYAWDQETASARFVRIATEITVPTAGTPAAPTVTGPQTAGSSLDLLVEIADAEVGMLYETTTGFTALQGRAERYNPSVFMALDLAQRHVLPGFQPIHDDQNLCNAATVSRPAGSSASYTNTTSSAAYGVYHKDASLNLGLDSDLAQYAAWFASITADPNQPRIPSLTLDLRNIGSTLQAAWLASEPLGKLMSVTGWPAQMDSATQYFFIEGYTETLSVEAWLVTLNLSPGYPFTNILNLEDAGELGRLELSGQTINTNASAGATSISVASSGTTLLTTTAGDYPMDLRVNGYKVHATACAGASSPQTVTVTALTAAVTAGQTIELWTPAVLAL
jgi:hypothetical protein